MIPEVMAVLLSFGVPSAAAGDRAPGRHVCLMDHACAGSPVFCLVDEGQPSGGECTHDAPLCLLSECEPALGPPRAPGSWR